MEKTLKRTIECASCEYMVECRGMPLGTKQCLKYKQRLKQYECEQIKDKK